MSRRRALLLMLSTLWAIMLIPIAQAAPPGAAARCFAETGQCVSGRFRQFWEQNGGLALFGYPIGPVQEVRRQDLDYVFYGPQIYLVQRFERVRMELHPENAPPYDVLLGTLGHQLVPTPRGPAAGPLPGCRWITMTSYNLCDQAPGRGFRSFWEGHGLSSPLLDAEARSIALFGYPLTEASVERNPTDGRTYLTQWFERARLEWHPELPARYKVLAGLLGREDPLVFTPIDAASVPILYLWPAQLPAGLTVLPDYSSVTAHGYLLALGAGSHVAGYLSAGTLASSSETAPPADHPIPPPSVAMPISVRGQPGSIRQVPYGQAAIWQEEGISYSLSLRDDLAEQVLRQATPFEALDHATWLQRLGAR